MSASVVTSMMALFARGLQSVLLPVQNPDQGGPSLKHPIQEKGNQGSGLIPFRYSDGPKGGIRTPTSFPSPPQVEEGWAVK